jgi:hypothetical protein
LAEASRLDASDGLFRPSDAARRFVGVVVIMNSARRLLARSLLTLATLSACLVAPARPCPAVPTDDPAAQQELAGIRPEGRLRKLHLVRPDLIPYPIAYEVYC